jgi:hypothetical protein
MISAGLEHIYVSSWLLNVIGVDKKYLGPFYKLRYLPMLHKCQGIFLLLSAFGRSSIT